MAEFVEVTNPHEVPVQVPGYGVLPAGETASAPRSARLRRAIEHGSLTTSGEAGPEPVEPVAAGDIAALAGSRGSSHAAGREPDGGYESQTVDELQAEADRRGLEVEGSGKDGNVLKADLVSALNADDQE